MYMLSQKPNKINYTSDLILNNVASSSKRWLKITQLYWWLAYVTLIIRESLPAYMYRNRFIKMKGKMSKQASQLTYPKLPHYLTMLQTVQYFIQHRAKILSSKWPKFPEK